MGIIHISTPLAEAELHTSGAHLARWTPRGHKPVLFLSPRSFFAPGKAIRGGVPIIFPWFGPRSDGRPGGAHGFARTMEWSKESERTLEDGRFEVVMALAANSETRATFDGEFRLRFRVMIGRQLEMELETTNEGSEPFQFEDALHTYFAVGDIRQVTISGLEGSWYVDKTDGFRRKQQAGESIRFDGERDQMHVNTDATCVIHDPAWERRIVVEKSGSQSTVVWNPWVEKTAALADMEPDGWTGMVCVESANAGENTIRLAHGETRAMRVRIRVEKC